MYVVAGVTGQTGSVVAATLLAARQPVRVIVRDIAKGAAWQARGAEVALASLDDRTSLGRALTGASGAYLLIPPSGWTTTDIPSDRARYAAALVGAVSDARPAHVVLLSSIGAQRASGTGPIRYIHPIENGLREAGVPASFLRAAFFMENWAQPIKTALASGSLVHALAARIPQVATADVGKTAAGLLVEGPPSGPRVVNIAGPADHTLEDVAAAVSTAVDRPIAAVSVPPAAMSEGMVAMGASREVASMYGAMAAAMNGGKLVWEGDVLRGSITLEQRIGELLA